MYTGVRVSAASPHEFGSPSIFKSATLGWRPPLSVKSDAVAASAGWRWGVCEANQGGGVFSYLRWKGRDVCVCVCECERESVCVMNVCAVCSQSNDLPRNGS